MIQRAMFGTEMKVMRVRIVRVGTWIIYELDRLKERFYVDL